MAKKSATTKKAVKKSAKVSTPRKKRTPTKRAQAITRASNTATEPPASSVPQRITNCKVSIVAPEQLPNLMAVSDGAAPVPESLWKSDFTWPVGNQLDTGACVGWAVGDGLIRWYLVKKGRLTDSEPLSVRYFWMAAKELDEFGECPTTFLEHEGTSIWAALQIAQRFGALKESLLPNQGKLFAGSQLQFIMEADRLKVSMVRKLERDLDVWARWLAKHGPLAVRLNVDANFELASAGSSHLDTYTSYPDPWNRGHAVLLVGYTTSIDGNPRFILRNSWGEAWGEQGYAYVSRGYAEAAITEAWGIYQ
jgi:C1A family cysteine protease